MVLVRRLRERTPLQLRQRASKCSCQPSLESTPYLRDLRGDHGHTVGLVRVPGEVIVMFLLGWPESIEINDLGCERTVMNLLHLRHDAFEERPLPLLPEEHDAPVLWADVVTLPSNLRGIVGNEEGSEEHLLGNDLWIDGDFNDLRMTGPLATDLPIGWVLGMPTCISWAY